MPVRFHVLASGSSGNACVLDVGGFGVLIDFGLPLRQLDPRMKRCRVSWDHIHAVLLTHGHTDHWNATTLSHLAKRRLPIYCHAEHLAVFNQESRAFTALSAAGLIRHYHPGERLHLHAECRCVPIALDHDADMTCGFRFDGPNWAIGYVADLGCWRSNLARELADVDLLGIEFNHDVEMQIASGRHPLLIRRVLGDSGHLSNDQGAALLAEVLRLSRPGRLRHVVQLHLSRDCNFPELAAKAAQAVVDGAGTPIAVHTTEQGKVGPMITLGEDMPATARRKVVQPTLPFAVG
jgi:phosphoribosyl 1,2-cyclic phosphodiesterase